MAWLANHARARGAAWWKASSTGKPASTHGGIPHDTYGMTSLSVRGYTTGIYRKLGLREEDIKKVQTGGPDGDLGQDDDECVSPPLAHLSLSLLELSLTNYSLLARSHRRLGHGARPERPRPRRAHPPRQGARHGQQL